MIKVLLFINLLTVQLSNIFSCVNYQKNPLILHKHTAALILARGGSKSIKLKNIQTVGNKTLLARSLEQIQHTKFDSIWVSTDHILIAKEAEKYNVNIHQRPSDTATDEASSLYAIQEFLDKHKEIDILALIQCTSPFIKQHYIEEGLELIKKFECVFSISRSYKLRWKKFNGKIIPLNFDTSCRPRRQDFTVELVENGMFYISKRKLITSGYLQSNK